MELWFFYAIIASLSIGINGYLVKLLSDRKVDGAIFTFLQGLTYLIWWFLQTVFMGDRISWWKDETSIIAISVIIAIIIFSNIRLRVRALHYLSSSEYYIGYRIGLTIILTILGVLFFKESISYSQYFGLFLWTSAIIFLFEDDKKLLHSRKWGNAILFLFLSIGAGVGIQIFAKLQGTSDFSPPIMLFYQWVTMLIISVSIDRKALRVYFTHWRENLNTLIIWIIATIFVYISAISVLNAYLQWGNMNIITKIAAYSLFVPIILSVIFSGEKVTYKKIIAFLLTIVSLYYLV